MNVVCDCEELQVEKRVFFFFSWGHDGNSKVRIVEATESDASEATFSGKNSLRSLISANVPNGDNMAVRT